MVAEIALALVLLVGAGLLLKSYARVQNIDPGFDRTNVLTAEIDLPAPKYPARGTAEYNHGAAMVNFWNEALRRVQQLPGVKAAAATVVLPLSGSNTDSSFAIEGRATNGKEPTPDEELRTITPDYFQVLRTPLLRGRFFTQSDTADAPPVAIVNEALAKKYWPNEDALGKRITFSDPRKPDPKWITIVGIVRSIRHRGLDVDPAPEYYLPYSLDTERSMVLVVRSAQDPRTLASAIRREIQSIDPDQPLANIRTLENVTADSVAPRRMSMVLLGAFAGIALLLAGVGIYGVISYLVVQRTHEIGVRMALGAQRSDVLRLVVGHAAKLVGIGSVIGLVLAFMSTRTLSALLYNVGAFDAATFAFVTIALAAVALLASYVPALRATRADPMIALGHGWRGMNTLLHDIRYGLRMLLKNKGFTAVAVVALALGIGANTAIFSLVNGVLLRPLPFPEAERIIYFEGKNPASALPTARFPAPFHRLVATNRSLREHRGLLDRERRPQWRRSGAGVAVPRAGVTIGFFSLCSVSSQFWPSVCSRR